MTAPKGNTLRSQVFGFARRLMPWVAIGCVVLALLPRANELKLCISRMSISYILVALVLCLAYWFFNAGVWSWILESLGYPIAYLTGVRVWLTSESLRWLPGLGSIYGFCSRVTAARGLGIPLRIASISLPLELSVVASAWGIVAAIGLTSSGLGLRLVSSYAGWIIPICAAALLGALGLRLAWPVLSGQPWFSTGLERLRTVLRLHLRRRVLIRSYLVYVGLNAVHGMGFWLMLAGMGYQHAVSPAAAIGANAAGWLLGFFAIGIPGGIGVREAGAALILSPLMPWQDAALAAALWRVLQIVAELVSLLPWLFIGPGERRAQLDSLVKENSLMKKPVLTQNRVLAAIVVATGLMLAAGAFALWPSYTNPESRFYTSAIGYLKVQRLLGVPMEAEAEHPVWHDFTAPILGEGTLQCDFYNVPVVPAARVTALHVEEGDKVEAGQLLAELDDTVAASNLRSAQLALDSATAEQARVEAGSVNTLIEERPERGRVSIEGLGEVLKAAEARVEMYRNLQASGASSRLELISAEADLATARLNYNQAQVDVRASNAGLPQSREIAQNAVNAAQNLLGQRQQELIYYRVTAPAAGTIDRVLIRNGEFNQNVGNPGFIIASGLWFEANLDQRALQDLHEGMEATVNLEAYTGHPFRATVQRIVPIVTFDAGGPETRTPVRPLGTGSPEWPATFTVRLHLDVQNTKLAPGMTGFARMIVHHRKALAIPRGALSSLSAGKGVVRIVDDAGHPVTTPVSLGEVNQRFVEITEGLNASDWVLSNNPRFLRDDDKIHITRIVASKD